MNSLRQKQNMEILDVFKDIHSQVNGLTRRQVQAFPETLKPKTQRDLTAEVTVDKAIESFNKTMETKLGALEFVVQNFERGVGIRDLSRAENKNVLIQSFQQTNNTGDLIPLWNGIVRSFKEIGLSRESQNIIRVKIQELAPNLEAMIYGLTQTIDYLFQQPFTETRGARGGVPTPAKKKKEAELAPAEGKDDAPALPVAPPVMARAESTTTTERFKSENALVILDYLRTLSLYKLIKQQVDSGNLELISVELMNSSYKDVFNTLSTERMDILKEVAPRGILGQSSIRNIPEFVGDYKERLDALGEELGIKFPIETYERFATFSKKDLDLAMLKFRAEARPIKLKISAGTLKLNGLVKELEELDVYPA